MLNDLIKQVSEKVGISEDQARSAVTMVIDAVKTKLPEPVAGQLDGLLSGNAAAGLLNQASGALGGLLGKKE